MLSVWDGVRTAWPLLVAAVIVAWMGRGRRWAAPATLAVLALAAAYGVNGALGSPFTSLRGEGGPLAFTTRAGEAVSLDVPVQDSANARIERAEVEIGSSVGSLIIAPGTAGQLVSGEVTPLRGEQVTQDVRRRGDTVRYRLGSRGRGPGFGHPGSPASRWDVRLAPDLPLDLTVRGGVGTTELNLADLTLERLDVRVGVGQMDLTLPARGRYEAEVDGGVGKLDVRLPKGLAARVRVDRGLGRVNVGGLARVGDDTYETPDYATARTRVDLEVEVGVGDVDIRR